MASRLFLLTLNFEKKSRRSDRPTDFCLEPNTNNEDVKSVLIMKRKCQIYVSIWDR